MSKNSLTINLFLEKDTVQSKNIMKIKNLETFEDLEAFLRNWVNAYGQKVPYDFNGAFHLLKAILHSMINHSLEADLEEYAKGLSQKEAAFLRKLIEYSRIITR
jgi:hypothetical protein